MKEIWKDIPNYEGYYKASNYGRVKSMPRKIAFGWAYRMTEEKFLKPRINNRGYYQVELCKNSKVRFYYVHRLVWEAFNGTIPEGLQVNHINEIKSDNRLSTLNLMTAKENLNYGSRNERSAKKHINGKKSKPVLQYDLQDNLIKEYPSIRQAYRETGFSHGDICRGCKGELKQAYGYKWKYKE